MPSITIAPAVLEVLKKATATGNVLFLNQPALDRKLYQATNTVLEAAGGKWDKKAKGHVFPGDPFEKLGISLDTGSIEKALTDKTVRQAFYTPPNIATRVAILANVNGKTVLEPSAGNGALVKEAVAAGAIRIQAIELEVTCQAELIAAVRRADIGGDHGQPTPIVGDFLKESAAGYPKFERVVMNPPFTDRADGKRGLNLDVKHVRHALDFLAPGGRLVAIMGGNTARRPFMELIAYTQAQGWEHDVDEVEAGAFKDAGTNVSTIILTVQK